MAERREMPGYLQEQPEDEPVVIPPRRGRLQQLFLDAGGILMLCGAVLVGVSTVGNPAADAMHGFLGFLLWILGVSLLTLMPVAGRFPRAEQVGVAVANAVLMYFAPWN